MPVVYAPIPLEEDGASGSNRCRKVASTRHSLISVTLVAFLFTAAAFIVGFFVGQQHSGGQARRPAEAQSPSTFVPSS